MRAGRATWTPQGSSWIGAEALFGEMGVDWWSEPAAGLRGRKESSEPFKWFAPYVDGAPAV